MNAHFDCHLTQLEDAKLGELSNEWRQRALRNEEGAQAIAQVLEGEVMRRQRKAEPPAYEEIVSSPPPTWLSSWRFGRGSPSA